MMHWVLATGELFKFPEVSWWILHVVAIVVIFTLGCLYGQKYAAKRAQKAGATSPPGGTGGI